jgi:hypothetical protein
MLSGGMPPPFLSSTLDEGEWSASSFCRFIRRGNGRRYPLYRRQRELQRMSGCYGEEENILSMLGIEPQLLSCPALSLVATNTELFRLLILIDTYTCGLLTIQKQKSPLYFGLLMGLWNNVAEGLIFLPMASSNWTNAVPEGTAEGPVTGWGETCKQIHCKLMTIAGCPPPTLFRS